MPTKTEDTAPKKERPWRLRQSYREDADRKNPNPAAEVYDSRGRLREPKHSHHSWIGKCRP